MKFEKQEDWPEKYDINKLVTRESDIEQILAGKKVSIRRNDRYADVDDQVLLAGHLFKVTDVYPQQLKNMSVQNAKEEGYKNLEAYKEALTSIHESVVWDPDQYVWAHYLTEK